MKLYSFLLTPFLFAASLCTAWSAERVALVVGCSAYTEPGMALDTPVNDARRMAALLQGPEMGFEVIQANDPNLKDFNRALLKFKEQASGAKVALLYYSGHGLEMDGENFLLPVDTMLEQAADVQTETVRVGRVLEELGATRALAKVLILDCCRDNPFGTTKAWAKTKSVRDTVLRELGEAEIPDATLVCFATGAGRKAAAVLDESSMNSPFTDALLKHLRTPGANVLDVFAAVHEDLAQATQGRQLPAVKTDNAISPALRKLVLYQAAPLSPAFRGLVYARRLRLYNTSLSEPYANSLGMKFVPALSYQDGRKVLFSVWETRRQDYTAYAEANPGVDATWKNMTEGGLPVGHGPDHPVVGVSWDDCTAFCQWLTMQERQSGRIGPQDEYRLPTDLEWSYAVGIGADEDPKATPEARNTKLVDTRFPWGTGLPPPNCGNYADTTATAAGLKVFQPLKNYTDGYATTAPVGSFTANKLGLHDLGGNVWEWCADWSNAKQETRVQRGSSWYGGWIVHMGSAYRGHVLPGGRNHGVGFRAVLVVNKPVP